MSQKSIEQIDAEIRTARRLRRYAANHDLAAWRRYTEQLEELEYEKKKIEDKSYNRRRRRRRRPIHVDGPGHAPADRGLHGNDGLDSGKMQG